MATTDLVPVEGQIVTIFGTDDPDLILQEAAKRAERLKNIVKEQGLVQRIGKSDHIQLEGWSALGNFFGVYAVPDPSPRELYEDLGRGPELIGFEAYVRAVRMADGAVVGAATARCTKKEKNWKDKDDYQLESMAQTRASGKALRGPLSFIMVLAGYKPTPAEEMEGVVEGEVVDEKSPGEGFRPSRSSSPPPPGDPASDAQWKNAAELFGSINDVFQEAQSRFPGIKKAKDITSAQMAELIKERAGK